MCVYIYIYIYIYIYMSNIALQGHKSKPQQPEVALGKLGKEWWHWRRGGVTVC
jgi:uncharacterized membrane protein (DUF106 family)